MSARGKLNMMVHGRQCQGKTRHSSQGKAAAAARSHEARFKEGRMNAYHCRFCKSWHIGHATED